MFSTIVFRLAAVILICSYVTYAGDLPKDCRMNNGILACENSIPTQLESNVSFVVIKDYLEDTISNTTFTDVTWGNVTSLDITVNHRTPLTLQDNNFFHLRKKLDFIGIHAPRLQTIGRYSFHGLDNLQTLDMSHSTYMDETLLLRAALESRLRISTLNLGYITSSHPMKVDQNLMYAVSKMKIQNLIFSGSNLVLMGPLNVTTLEFVLRNLDLSNTTMSSINVNKADHKQIADHFAKNLKELNISYTKLRFLDIDNNIMPAQTTNCNFKSVIGFLFKVEILYFDGMYSNVNTNTFHNISACKINLRSWYLRHNNIRHFNISIEWPKETAIKKIDLSYNFMTYINPNFLSGLMSLELLNLASNELSSMEKLKEFSFLLKPLSTLRVFNISYNKVTYIPNEMFENCGKLIILDLSNNDLTDVTFNLQHLHALQELRLQYNRISTLRETEFQKLTGILHLSNTNDSGVDIDFTGNPIQCSCETVNFLEWVYTTLEPVTRRSHECNMEGKMVRIERPVIKKSQFLCIKDILVGSISCACVIIVLVAGSITTRYILVKIKRRRMKTRRQFLYKLTNGLLQQNYLCFFSYSSEDDYEMRNNIYSSITQVLNDVMGVSADFVCTSDKDFRLGYPITDEIFRCVNASCAMVCLVSRAFCQSNWCETEMRIAYEKRTPIILIFLEKVQESIMPPILKNIFSSQTRANYVEKDGNYDLIPSYDILAQSITDLAFGACLQNTLKLDTILMREIQVTH